MRSIGYKMPLLPGKSKKAFEKNVKTEMDAHPGKERRAQNLAIAYSMKKRSPKKMASGGVVEYGKGPEEDMEPGVPSRKKDDARPDGYMAGDFTSGSQMDDDEDTSMGPKKDEYGADLATGKAYANGGSVAPPKPTPAIDKREKTGTYIPYSSEEVENEWLGGNYEKPGDNERPEAQEKPKGYAKGGVVEYGAGPEADMEPAVPKRKSDDYRRPEGAYMGKDWAGEPELDDASDTSMGPAKSEYDAVQWAAKGGEIEPHELMSDDERSSSIADAIMKKRAKTKAMADGGMVDLEANSEEQPNNEDDYSFDAVKKEQYDLDQLGPDPMDSNEHGDAIDSDKNDMVSQIRKKMRAKRGM
jgi:hypothetical protein